MFLALFLSFATYLETLLQVYRNLVFLFFHLFNSSSVSDSLGDLCSSRAVLELAQVEIKDIWLLCGSGVQGWPHNRVYWNTIRKFHILSLFTTLPFYSAWHTFAKFFRSRKNCRAWWVSERGSKNSVSLAKSQGTVSCLALVLSRKTGIFLVSVGTNLLHFLCFPLGMRSESIVSHRFNLLDAYFSYEEKQFWDESL